MIQLTVALGDDANPSLIRQVLENMKGVLKVSIQKDKSAPANENNASDKMLTDLQGFVNKIDKSVIDIDDDRTRHILRGSELLNELESNR